MENKRKVKAFFTIDPDLYEEFEKHIDKNLLDKSKLIEFLIKEYLEKKGKCCGNQCRHCPYDKSEKGNTSLRTSE